MQQRLACSSALVGEVVLECARRADVPTIAALCIEGEEAPAGLHVLSKQQRLAALRTGIPKEQLWSPYGDWGRDGNTLPFDDAFAAADLEAIKELQRTLEAADRLVDRGIYMNALIGRWVGARASRYLDVTDDFVAYALPYDFGSEVWQSLWLSTTPEQWARLQDKDLVPTS